MGSSEDEEPNSGLWGKVELEDLPNPGALPPPPASADPIITRKGTLMGFALPQSGEGEAGAMVTAFRRTPSTGTASADAGKHTPMTSPLGAIASDQGMVSGSPQVRSYQRSDNPARTLIGGTAPVVEKPRPRPAVGPHATTPGFSPLPDQGNAQKAAQGSTGDQIKVSKETLIGIAMPQAVLDALKASGDAPAATRPAGSLMADAPASEPPSSRSADHLGRFRIEKRLGTGGAGAVYLARKVDDAAGQRELAIKVLREHVYRDPAALKALFREARLAARMDHRHLVRVMDIGYHKRQPYLVMEYVDGLSLAVLLGHPVKVPIPVGIRCLVDALYGLDYAHKLRGDEGEPLGLVHCDVSPQNMLVGVDGVTKLTDFGVARTREEDGDEFVLRCTPEYAAPELLKGEEVRPETDVYSAGAVLFRLVTGQTAVSGDTEEGAADSVLNGRIPLVSQVKPGLPAWLDEFCAQAMALEPNDRFRSCLDMARALERQAEADGLIADRATVGSWVKRVRRSMEGGEHFALSELGTIINPKQGPELGPGKVSTAPPPADGEDEVQSLAAKLGLGITGAILVAGALIWFLLSPGSFKSVFSTSRQTQDAPAGSVGSAPVPGQVGSQLEQQLPLPGNVVGGEDGAASAETTNDPAPSSPVSGPEPVNP